MIRFYNSLHRKKEDFVPIREGHVGMYTCGPTVYGDQHIGNMRAYITWDIVKRFLTAQKFQVTHIMNITDVGHLTSDADSGDDKMELAGARERLDAWQVADKYFAGFQADLAKLNIIPPTKYVRATALIQEQIDFVKILDEKGFLYRTSDGMYFDTAKDPEYGKLGKLDIGGLLSGARVEENPEKKSKTDFAVWKFSPADSKRTMEWDSPWGKGFPGWHLECSVIAREALGDEFDIHAGGIDHLTVHHPNEIAQSKAVTGKIPAHYWLHNNFVNFQNKKMAKSAGTFVRIDDIAAGGVSPLAYRYFVLQTHYRKEIGYSWEAVQAAAQGLANLSHEISFFDAPTSPANEYMELFYEALADDLNTSKALDILQRIVKLNIPSAEKAATVFFMDEVLGLSLQKAWELGQTLPAEAQGILKEREAARAARDFDRADRLREKLLEFGVEVVDTPEGQRAARAA